MLSDRDGGGRKCGTNDADGSARTAAPPPEHQEDIGTMQNDASGESLDDYRPMTAPGDAAPDAAGAVPVHHDAGDGAPIDAPAPTMRALCRSLGPRPAADAGDDGDMPGWLLAEIRARETPQGQRTPEHMQAIADADRIAGAASPPGRRRDLDYRQQATGRLPN